jgi:hypothetical protein
MRESKINVLKAPNEYGRHYAHETQETFATVEPGQRRRETHSAFAGLTHPLH